MLATNVELNIEDRLIIKPIINLTILLLARTWFKNKKVQIYSQCSIKISIKEKEMKMQVKNQKVMREKNYLNVGIINLHQYSRKRYVLTINK